MRRPNSRGFTLIELLIVVVIIGILAAIAVPKFSNTKEQSFLATMKSDLRNLATAQEAYLYDNQVYYTGALPSGGINFRVSRGVSITLMDVQPSGWSATAGHNGTTKTCALFVGLVTPVAPASIEGEARCN